jgi:NADH-quinone oxidoreductase subunit N
MDWRDLWNPAAIFSGVGTLGLLVSSRRACESFPTGPVPVACWLSHNPNLSRNSRSATANEPPTQGRWGKDSQTRSVAQRWIAPCGLLAVLLAALSWSDATSDDVARATFTVSLIWGTLLTVLHWNDERSSELPLQFVLLGGLCLMSQAGDVVTLFLGLQIASLGASVLTSPRGRLVSNGRFPLPWLLLLGFVLLAAVTGSTRLETIHEALQTSYVHRESAKFAIAGGGSRVLMLSSVLIGTALAGYAVCAPFHFLFVVPPSGGCNENNRLKAEPRTLPALLFPRVAALLAWVKLWPGTITASESTAQLLIGVLAAITSVVPLLQARVERNLVKQWWLLAVAQGAWLLLAIGAWSFVKKSAEVSPEWPVVEWNLPTAAQAAWLLLLLDGVAVIGLSGVLAYLRRRERPVEFVDDLRGLIHFEPIAAVCACVCLLSLSGLPLLAGFWSRLFVALTAMNVRGEWGPPALLIPHSGLLLLTAFVALSAVWSASIAMRSVWTMLFGMPLGQPRPVGAVSSLFSAVLASIMLVGCGVLPGPLLSWLCAPRVEQHTSQEPPKGPPLTEDGSTQ